MDILEIKSLGLKVAMQLNPTIYVFYKNREPPRKYYLVGEWEQELATEWDKKVYVNGRS
jgi:hypothetical protein